MRVHSFRGGRLQKLLCTRSSKVVYIEYALVTHRGTPSLTLTYPCCSDDILSITVISPRWIACAMRAALDTLYSESVITMAPLQRMPALY